nr:hypothetical protein [Tanacetum cinerariifolium]
MGDGDEDDNDNEMGFIKFLDFARSTRIPLASRTTFKQMQPVFATVAVIDPFLSTLVGTILIVIEHWVVFDLYLGWATQMKTNTTSVCSHGGV